MQDFIKQIFLGTEILFGKDNNQIKRKKSLDIKKELRIAKQIRKTSIIQRSSNRIKRISAEALGE